MEIDQLRAFVEVLEQESFSRAAERLRIRQSTVSFQIKALETSIGARLLDRGNGRVSPTPTGRTLRRYALRILGTREEALAKLRNEESSGAGVVTISASTIPSEYLLPTVVAEFRKARPAVSISITVSDSEGALYALRAGDCDIAVVGARTSDKQIAQMAFADDEIVLVASPQTRALCPDLTSMPLVVREEGSGTQKAVASLLARRMTGRDNMARIQVSGSEAARRCVLAGVGAAFLSRRAVDDDLREGRVVVIPTPETPIHRRFYASHLRTTTLAAAPRAFLSLLTSSKVLARAAGPKHG